MTILKCDGQSLTRYRASLSHSRLFLQRLNISCKRDYSCKAGVSIKPGAWSRLHACSAELSVTHNASQREAQEAQKICANASCASCGSVQVYFIVPMVTVTTGT